MTDFKIAFVGPPGSGAGMLVKTLRHSIGRGQHPLFKKVDIQISDRGGDKVPLPKLETYYEEVREELAEDPSGQNVAGGAPVMDPAGEPASAKRPAASPPRNWTGRADMALMAANGGGRISPMGQVDATRARGSQVGVEFDIELSQPELGDENLRNQARAFVENVDAIQFFVDVTSVSQANEQNSDVGRIVDLLQRISSELMERQAPAAPGQTETPDNVRLKAVCVSFTKVDLIYLRTLAAVTEGEAVGLDGVRPGASPEARTFEGMLQDESPINSIFSWALETAGDPKGGQNYPLIRMIFYLDLLDERLDRLWPYRERGLSTPIFATSAFGSVDETRRINLDAVIDGTTCEFWPILATRMAFAPSADGRSEKVSPAKLAERHRPFQTADGFVFLLAHATGGVIRPSDVVAGSKVVSVEELQRIHLPSEDVALSAGISP